MRSTKDNNTRPCMAVGVWLHGGVQTGHREQHTVTYKLTKQLHKIHTLRYWRAKLILPQLTCLAYVAGRGHRACVAHWTGITVAWIDYRQEHKACKHFHNMYMYA